MRWLGAHISGPAMRLAAGSALGQLVFLLFTPLLTRVYGPADFGVVAVFYALTSFDVVVCLGYERAVVLPESEDQAGRLAWVALVCAIVVAICGSLAVLAVAESGMSSTVTANKSWLPWASGAALFVFGLSQISTMTAIRHEAYGRVAIAKFVQLASTGAIQAALGLGKAGAAGLIFGHIGGMALCCLLLGGLTVRSLLRVDVGDVRSIRSAAASFAKFPQYVLPGQGLNAISLQVPPAALVGLYGESAGGLYSFAFRLIGAPLSVIIQAISQSLLGAMARAKRDGSIAEALHGITRGTAGILILLSIPLVGMLVFAPSIFGFAFGPGWRTSGELLQLMSPMIIAQLLITPFHGLIDVLGRQEIHARREMLRLLLLAVSLLGAMVFAPSLKAAVLMISLSSTIAYLVGALGIFYALREAARPAC